MNVDRAEAEFWAGFLRNRNIDEGTALDGALPVAGGFALYAAGTMLERAIGLGTVRPLADVDLRAVEDFYARRATAAVLELDEESAGRDAALLSARGYAAEPEALVRRAGPVGAFETPPSVRIERDRRRWTSLALRAHEVAPELHARFRNTFSALASAGAVLFVVSVDGADAGVGALAITGQTALLFSGAVLPHARRRGAHRALTAARLATARARGADVATVKARAGSAVERTAEAFGLALLGRRTTYRRAP